MRLTDQLVLIADDLTGSLDAGVQLSQSGVSTFVKTPEAAWKTDAEAAVLVTDIESRHVAPAEAASRVVQQVEGAARAGASRFYKKTDSTLRGNVGAELAALLHATRAASLYFVPALPRAGRITRGGVQYVDGVPLHRSRYSRDAVDPVRKPSIPAIIASQADTPVVCVPRGVDPLSMPVDRGRPVIFVLDAESNQDLQEIAERLAVLDPPPLTAGCAGFAAVLPRLLGLPHRPASAAVLRPPLLVVCGSRDEVSRRQVREAEVRGVPRWSAADADAEQGAMEALRAPGAAILVAGESLADTRRLVRRVTARVRVGTLAVFGGDTAFSVVTELGVSGMWPAGEICPGVVVSRTAPAAAMHLVTKAGGFGPADVIQRILESLCREE